MVSYVNSHTLHRERERQRAQVCIECPKVIYPEVWYRMCILTPCTYAPVKAKSWTLQHTAKRCNPPANYHDTLATHCGTLQHTRERAHRRTRDIAAHCSTLLQTARHCNTPASAYAPMTTKILDNATPCNILQHTATTLQHTSESAYAPLNTDSLTLQYIAIHCNTLQHTATHLQVRTRH